MFRRTIPALGLLALMLALASHSLSASGQEHGPAAVVKKPAEQGTAVPKTEGETIGQEFLELDAGHQPNIIEPQAPLAIWTLVVFGGLMLVLGRYAWKPLMKALHEREAHLEQVLLDSERARNEAEATATRNRKELALAADQVRALIEEARKEATVAANSIIQKAQAEAESSRQRAEREIAGAKDQALMEIWSQTADLAVSVAGKVLSKELGESDHRRLVEMAMSELPANGQGGEARS